MTPAGKFVWYEWMGDNVKAAADFYGHVVGWKAKDSGMSDTSGRPYTILSAGDYGAAGMMTILFSIEGQRFLALNGGPHFAFTPAISLIVNCETQAELDEYWRRLSEGGAKGPCGWLTDKFGVSWQIVPRELPELLTSGDVDQANRVMKAVLAMGKLDIAAVRRAAGPN